MIDEFYEINKDIFDNKKFNELKNYRHHGITRYDHCYNVAYLTYRITRKISKNYKEITRAALLHDFFTDEVDNMGSIKRFVAHPKYALENSKKYFNISKLQEDIILSHMFPVGLKVPKYKESWLVDIVDNISSIYERMMAVKEELVTAATFVLVLIMSYIK